MLDCQGMPESCTDRFSCPTGTFPQLLVGTEWYSCILNPPGVGDDTLPCPDGSAKDGLGVGACVECRHGYAARETANNFCLPCRAGTYSDDGAIECTACPSSQLPAMFGCVDECEVRAARAWAPPPSLI